MGKAMRVLVYGCAGHICGGIETFLLNMNAHMSCECVFDYIFPGGSCLHAEKIQRKGGRVFLITPPRANPLGHLGELIRVFRSQRTQTRIAYFNLYSMADPAPIWIARCLGYRVVLHTHNNGLQTRSRAYTMLHLLGKRLLRGGNYVRWTNSHASARFMFGEGVPAELIYNAIDVGQFRFDATVRARVRAGPQASATVVGFVGRLAEQKNPLFMLRVFHSFLGIDPEAKLWIVGEGGLEYAMRQEIAALKIEDSVLWYGSRNDVHELMQGMDLLLQPSIFEGLGIVLVEAQASGLPCVTSAGVVPQEPNVSRLLRYVPLGQTPPFWARQCALALEEASALDRSAGYEAVADSGFNIFAEARRMEQMLSEIAHGECLPKAHPSVRSDSYEQLESHDQDQMLGTRCRPEILLDRGRTAARDHDLQSTRRQ